MITKTTLTAVRALILVARNTQAGALSPRRIAEVLNESPTYTAKVTATLVKAGILRAGKGVKGGVSLARTPEEITLRHVFEACQGAIVGDFCQPGCDLSTVCSFHAAAADLHNSLVTVLSRWTLAHMLRRPEGVSGKDGIPCMMTGVSTRIL